MPSDAAVVVAHPDDEVLWLSSVLGSVERFVFCFEDVFGKPRKSRGRKKAVAALPLSGIVDLGLRESGGGFAVDWSDPQPTEQGVEITDAWARARYAANYAKLVEALRAPLAAVSHVYTHNPWGEYGHAEHIQVHRAVRTLQGELGYTIWFSNYAGAASWPLAQKLADELRCSQRRAVRPDLAAARTLMRVYRQHGAWTWTKLHRWPAEETLYALAPAASGQNSRPMAGEWLLDVAGLRRWAPPWRKSHRRLP